MAAVMACVCVGLLASVRWASDPPGILTVRLIWGFCGLAAVTMSLLLTAAASARLERVGDALRVRLSPFRVHDVPLELVECFFLGSEPLKPPGSVPDDRPSQRVGTLVIRLAERAVDWRERPTLAEWGSWREGNIVCDGRWCEPLSADLVRTLTRRLVDAKRSLATARSAAEGGP